MYKGLDTDEAEFLDNVLNKESDRDKKEREEMEEQLKAYKISFNHYICTCGFFFLLSLLMVHRSLTLLQ